MQVTRDTKLADIISTPAGHDILMKALYAAGLDGNILKKGPLSKLTLGMVQKLSCGAGTEFLVTSGFAQLL